MLSLRQLLAAHAPLLLLDAASERVQVGLFGSEGSPRWAARRDDAGVGLFGCLDELDVDIGSVRAFAFCEGPGSILGIRTAAMALRTWGVLAPRPFFAYGSLALAAQSIGRTDIGLIADARRGFWHHLALGGALRRIPASELAGELVMPEGFRHWSPLPPRTSLTPYALENLLARPAVADAPLFRRVEAPDAFLHEEPAYATWTPHVHRAP